MTIFARISTMSGPGEELRTAIEHAVPRLHAITDVQAADPRAPGKWSPKEVMGHLIDSASNNHGRFVRAQLTHGLLNQGYAQDDWVKVQHYAEADWNTLIDLWEVFNLHLARVMDLTPEDVRLRERGDHDLPEVAFGILPQGTPATLDWFMRDYVEHLEHHLGQIDPGLVRS